MLRIIQSTLLSDIANGTRTLAPFLDNSIPNIDERIDIFINNRIYGHLDYLKSIYPVCLQIMGDAFFEQIAKSFINNSTQLSGNRHDYGGEFAGFLLGNESVEQIGYVIDIAKIEWAHFRAFIADDAEVSNLAQIGELLAHGQKFGLTLVPSASMINLDYNSLEIWQAHQNSILNEIALKKVNSLLLCWRSFDDEIMFYEIDENLFKLLKHPNLEIDFAQSLEEVIERAKGQEEIAIFQNQFAAIVQTGALKLS